MPVTLMCPRLTCRAVLCVPDEVRGKRVRCSECGITLLVPTAHPKTDPATGRPESETTAKRGSQLSVS